MEQNKNENQEQDKNKYPMTFVEARVAISRDGEYLLHFFDDKIVRKHINLYKHLLKVPYTRKSNLPVVA